MNPFLLPSDERLADWMAFRRSLAELDTQNRLSRVAAYFAQAPLTKIAYDPERPADWPTPWEMIHRGEWDRDITAVGIEATLRLSGIAADRLELLMLHVPADATLRMVVLVDRVATLNYAWGSVAEMPAVSHARRRWRFDGRGYAEF